MRVEKDTERNSGRERETERRRGRQKETRAKETPIENMIEKSERDNVSLGEIEKAWYHH